MNDVTSSRKPFSPLCDATSSDELPKLSLLRLCTVLGKVVALGERSGVYTDMDERRGLPLGAGGAGKWLSENSLAAYGDAAPPPDEREHASVLELVTAPRACACARRGLISVLMRANNAEPTALPVDARWGGLPMRLVELLTMPVRPYTGELELIMLCRADGAIKDCRPR
jgi:hypothetical protein